MIPSPCPCCCRWLVGLVGVVIVLTVRRDVADSVRRRTIMEYICTSSGSCVQPLLIEKLCPSFLIFKFFSSSSCHHHRHIIIINNNITLSSLLPYHDPLQPTNNNHQNETQVTIMNSCCEGNSFCVNSCRPKRMPGV